jgi:uncharacterized membrane protein
MHGIMGMASISTILMWALIITVIYFIFKSIKKEDNPMHRSPLEIAKSRFASGEITKDEFDEIKSAL